MTPMVSKRETELFLQAFEKPTQLYRYMREHHLFSPAFLHRNLSYMSGRMSRRNAKRKITQVDEICNSLHAAKKRVLVPYKMRLERFSFDAGNHPKHALTQVDFLTVNGCDDAKKLSQLTNVLKSIQLKADGETSGMKSIDVLFDDIKHSMVGGETIIKIRARTIPTTGGHMDDDVHDDETVYEGDLLVLDKGGKCVLKEGEYKLSMHVRSTNGEKGDNRTLWWEELPRLSAEKSFSKDPRLKFRLVWLHSGQQDCNGNVNKRNASDAKLCDNSAVGVEPLLCIDVSSSSSSSSSSSISNSSSGSSSGSSSRSSSSSGHGTMIDRATNNNNNDDDVSNKNTMSRIIYRFIYKEDMYQKTETFENWKCPWCRLNCFCLESLRTHLCLMHDQFKFEFKPTPQAMVINVRRSQLVAKRKRKNGYDKSLEPEKEFFLDVRNTRHLASATVTAAPIEPHVVQFAKGHNRLYYRSQSCMPIYTKDEFEVDSEGEPDPDWLIQNCKKLVNEFTDVNEGEKEIMNLWNAHVMKHNYVSDVQMENACELFIENHAVELKRLRRNFLLHLTNLYEFGLITCGAVHKMALKCSEFIAKN